MSFHPYSPSPRSYQLFPFPTGWPIRVEIIDGPGLRRVLKSAATLYIPGHTILAISPVIKAEMRILSVSVYYLAGDGIKV